MEGPAVIADALERISGSLQRSLTGVPAETLCRRPSADTNSMAWLVWHLTRVQDDHIAALAGTEQVWASGGWHSRFGIVGGDTSIGTGHTPEQVEALKVESAEALLEYNAAVLAQSKAYLATLSADDLDRVLNEPQWDPMPTVGVRLVSIVSDNTQHAGQAAYLRGLFEGKGWQRV